MNKMAQFNLRPKWLCGDNLKIITWFNAMLLANCNKLLLTNNLQIQGEIEPSMRPSSENATDRNLSVQNKSLNGKSFTYVLEPFIL